MRIHQWPKNLLVFLPAVTSQRFHDYFLFLASLKAFLAFCATASAVYLINDVADLAHDRQHLAKRLRPFAAGTLSPFSSEPRSSSASISASPFWWCSRSTLLSPLPIRRGSSAF
jgi:hypothetical protein